MGAAFAILDNASNQSTELVHRALTNVFHGNFAHIPAYSPHFAPIEDGFANIRQFIRSHEPEAYEDPVELIDKAFRTYSVSGEKGSSAYGHFNLYFANFELRKGQNEG